MRAMPGIRPSFFLFAAASISGSGCFLNADAFGGGGDTTTSTGLGGTTSTTTTPSGGTGGATGGTTSSGGTGGQTHTGGAGGNTVTGGAGGAPPVAESCSKHPTWLSKQSGVVTIHPIAADQDIEVYCDQVNMGGGWALVYSSVEDPIGLATTAFWKISKMYALSKLPADATPSPDKNFYAGNLYNYGTEYRDDIVDSVGVVAYGALHAYTSGINASTMRFMMPSKAPDNLSDLLYKAQFSSGWSSYDFDGDDEGGGQNNAIYWSNVSQHYAYNMYWGYNLGSDQDNVTPGQNPPDFTDAGIGPHVSNAAIAQVNASLGLAGLPLIKGDSDLTKLAARVKRITRWARW